MTKQTTTTSGPKALSAWVAFVIAYFAARALLESLQAGPLVRAGVAILPIPVFAYALLVYIRLIRSADELERLIQLEALAVAFPLALILIMTLGLLQLAIPLPPEDWSYRHVWVYLPIFYFAGLALARRRYQ